MGMLKWRDYDPNVDKEIDSWILANFSKNAHLINKYAFFNEPASEQYHWYKEHPKEGSNIADFFKVVEINNEVIAFLILNYFRDDSERLVLGVNPIAVEPNQINKGNGTLVLTDLITNSDTIIGHKVDVFYAGIDEKNNISTKVFKNLGFKESGRSDDKEFVYYELKR